jgi:hypothetical protein
MREGMRLIAMCVNAGCLPSIAAFSLVSIHFVHSARLLARTLGPERKMCSHTLLMTYDNFPVS